MGKRESPSRALDTEKEGRNRLRERERERERMMQARSVSRATTVCSARPRTVKVSAVSRPNRLFLGINDPILGFILVSVFGAVWAVFSQSTKELGAGEEDGDDGGLSL